MTALLEKAFAKASHLSHAAQEQLAEQVLEDIKGELKWDQTLLGSQPALEKMAANARRAKRDGRIVRKGIDEL